MEQTSFQDKSNRIAIVNPDKCRPKKCKQECAKTCPINKQTMMCISVTHSSTISFINEAICVGCGMCVKKCPFGAIKIINLPKELPNEVTHRYGYNAFKLIKLPTPRPGEVLGLVGANGTGKSTALKILSNQLQPNLGSIENESNKKNTIKFFKGSELQNYFTRLYYKELKTIIKGQQVDSLIHTLLKPQMRVIEALTNSDENNIKDKVIEALDLNSILDRQLIQLSGGELQRFFIAITTVQKGDIYMFDEPSSYLDVKQRLNAAKLIRSLCSADNYIIAVEHDLSILDYLSDSICVLYGVPQVYGVVTMPYAVGKGINIFLDGYIPELNMRFRDEEFLFRVVQNETAKGKEISEEEFIPSPNKYKYPKMTKTLENFKIHVNAGQFEQGEIIVMLGQNGTGKTTLIKMLAGIIIPDDPSLELPHLNISYKPQTISPKFQGTVDQLLYEKLGKAWETSDFKTEVTVPLQIHGLLQNNVQTLSGGELQRVGLALALAKPCDIYLIDEPSAYLDSEQRFRVSKVIKRWVFKQKRSAFIVEHDFNMATYLADKVIVFDGIPAQQAECTSPQGLICGMNKFLQMMQITFRRDPSNFRPRINKLNSQKDEEQKGAGNYFLMEGNAEEEKKEEEKKT